MSKVANPTLNLTASSSSVSSEAIARQVSLPLGWSETG